MFDNQSNSGGFRNTRPDPARQLNDRAHLGFFLLLFGCSAAFAQTPSGGTPLPAMPLGPNDLVSVAVFGVPQLSRTVRVDRDGSLQMPLVTKPIPAAGKLPSDLESEVAAALRRDELVVDPVVTITVTEYVSRQITVAGAVHSPSTIQAMTTIRLLEAIAKAGGLSDDAGPEVLLQTKNSSGETVFRHIAVKALMGAPDENSNPVLFPGDEVRVPRAPRIFIMGNVRKPGAILLSESAESSVMKAIALAEGLSPFSTSEAWILRPKPGSSEREQISVPLARIMSRKSPDVLLQAEDIFYVPDNKTKRISTEVLDRVASFGSSTGSGMLIWKK